MKNKVLVFLMMFLCFQVIQAQKTYPVTKEVKVEENGFCWTLYSTRKDVSGLLTEGAEVNGKTLLPLYHEYCYIEFNPLGDNGIFSTLKTSDDDDGIRCYFYNLDGEEIYQTEDLGAFPAYNEEEGLYFRGARDFKEVLTPKRDTSGRIDSKKVKNEKIPFPLVASRKYKIKSTFMGEESHAFSGDGYVEYKGNKIIINLGFTTKEYTLNQPPKPLLGVLGMFFEARDVTCDGEKGKLSIVETQNTISIEPIGFSMSLGYAVGK